MTHGPAVLCPIDFSDSSRGALRYAAAVAAHFGARLTLLTVNDPVVRGPKEFVGDADQLVTITDHEVERFFEQTFPNRPHGIHDVRILVTAGVPAIEILRVCRERPCDLIVMSSHGSRGFRKLFFGSTTERVLHGTTVPILVTPGGDPGPVQLEDLSRHIGRVLVPVDLSKATHHQLDIAQGLAEAISVPLVLLHVVQPSPSLIARRGPASELVRGYRAERELETAMDHMPGRALASEALIVYGEPSEEIARIARERDVGLIVMGLHSSPLHGPRMGAVTYRLLRLAGRLVLAVPPQPAPRQAPRDEPEHSAVVNA